MCVSVKNAVFVGRMASAEPAQPASAEPSQGRKKRTRRSFSTLGPLELFLFKYIEHIAGTDDYHCKLPQKQKGKEIDTTKDRCGTIWHKEKRVDRFVTHLKNVHGFSDNDFPGNDEASAVQPTIVEMLNRNKGNFEEVFLGWIAFKGLSFRSFEESSTKTKPLSSSKSV